tara:strand:- start:1015 stop:1416 length:402 start_codon:yes stop_codon:yes gene_type:complete
MSPARRIEALSKNFRMEETQLRSEGITSWEMIKELREEDLLSMVRIGNTSIRNYRKLQCMANLICDIGISNSEASLLIHSGIPSLNAIAALSPSELIKRTTRLQLQLNIGRGQLINVSTAKAWIQKAKLALTS